MIELHSGSLPVARAALRALRELPGLGGRPPADEAALDAAGDPERAPRPRPRPLGPHAAGARLDPRRGGDRRRRARPARPRLLLEAAAAGAAIAAPPGALEQPELAAAAIARLAGDDEVRERKAAAGRARRRTELRARSRASWTSSTAGSPYAVAAATEPRAAMPTRLPTGRGSSATCTCTPRGRTTARSASRSCSTTPRPRGSARSRSPTTTSFGGALEAVELARGRKLIVIPGEEVKTDVQGEVIGLFLREEIPGGLSFADTIEAIREQGGLVYLPHPFDRMHAIADPTTLHRHLGEIDVFEVYNARLLFETYNDEAVRFARKYNLIAGRRLGRARAPGRRHGRAPDARVRRARRSSCSPCAGPRCCAVRSRSPTSRASSGWPRSRKRCARREPRSVPVSAVPTDEIYERYLQKAISEINELGDEIGRGGDELHVPVLGSGHPLADVFLLKYEPRPVRGPGGRRLLRPGRAGDPEVAPAAARRPAGRLRDELPEARRPGSRGGAAVARSASCTSSSRSSSS